MSDKLKNAILQRDKETYAIVPRTLVGLVTPENGNGWPDLSIESELKPLKKLFSNQAAYSAFNKAVVHENFNF